MVFRSRRGRRESALDGSGDDPGAQRLGEHEQIAGPRGGVCQQPLRDAPTRSRTSRTVGSALRTVCPPTSAHPASRTLAAPPRQDLRDHLGGHQVVRNGQEIERGERTATHRVHVRKRVGGGDLAKRKGVIDDRGEKIGRLDERTPGIETINPCIVGGVTADEEIGVAPARAG